MRTLAAACLAATAALTGTTGPAFAAAPDTTPAIDPFSGPVSGVQSVTATSTAAFVRFTAFDGDQTAPQSISAFVPVDGGTATWSWETWGFRGASSVVAQDCDGETVDTCGPVSTEQVADVDNTATTDLPTSPVLLDPDVDAEKTLPVNVDAGSAGGTLSLSWPKGSVSAPATAGTPAVLDFSGVQGPLTDKVVLQRCSTLDATICADDATSEDVTVRRALYPKVQDLSTPVISPNGDGRLDSADVTAWFDAGTQKASWRLLDANGSQVGVVQALDLGTLQGKEGTLGFTVDPTKVGSTPDGAYTLELDSAGTILGHDFTGTDTKALVLDTTPANRIDSVTLGRSTVYPVHDGYQDTVSFRVKATALNDDAASTVTVLVHNAAGSVVRTMGVTPGQTASWDGRSDGGALVPEGKYTLEATAVDGHGNAAVSVFSSPLTLSHKKLTTVSWTRTVSAQSSFAGNDSGRCGALRRPGLRGWSGGMGYYSNATCKPARAYNGIAVGVHGIYLPSAISYSSVKVEAYGGAAKAGARDAAAVNWLLKDNGGILSKYFTIGPKPGWHAGGSPSPRSVVWSDHSILWAVVTSGGARYDVAKFRVTVVRTVLR